MAMNIIMNVIKGYVDWSTTVMKLYNTANSLQCTGNDIVY